MHSQTTSIPARLSPPKGDTPQLTHPRAGVPRHIDGAESRELALKRLEQALADDDFQQFSEHVLTAIGHSSTPDG